MPGNRQLPDLRQKLEQLNRLEDAGGTVRRTGRSVPVNQPLMESLRSNLPSSVLAQHDRLRSRGRRSMAVVRKGVCSGCHMNLPVGIQSEVKRQSSLLRCDYCGRFLFPAENEVTGPVFSGEVAPPQSARKQGKSK